MLPPWADQYIGIPFRDRGRTASGWDCWGLVWYVERYHFDKQLPALADDYGSALDSEAIAALADITCPLVGAERVGEPLAGDIAIMRYRGLPCHVGVCLGDGAILHVRPDTGTVIDRADAPMMRARVEGYYRV